MSSYTYKEPEKIFKPLVGEYPFTVTEVGALGPSKSGAGVVLPVTLTVRDGGRDVPVRDWLFAGPDRSGGRVDKIAPFLKAIRRAPAVGEEPDLSRRALLGCAGTAKFKANEKDYSAVQYYLYEDGQATVSRGPDAPPRAYDRPRTLDEARGNRPGDDGIPF
ncbi:MAG: hypothetical protein LBK60_03100 [Verrucomicrobiales bacterium]|jgi:hypothetical protein|nr:hypothetical protein [Verrucomicrobiales bacterium]